MISQSRNCVWLPSSMVNLSSLLGPRLTPSHYSVQYCCKDKATLEREDLREGRKHSRWEKQGGDVQGGRLKEKLTGFEVAVPEAPQAGPG